jgi:hypothetical protein
MTGTAQTLTFLSWVRPQISGLAKQQSGGRAQAGTSIMLTESGADGTPGRTETQPVSFLLAGPADVAGLQLGAIVRRYPAPGVVDHESNHCPYIELADPTLPWRYTPAQTPVGTPPGAGLHPWLVLVVGQEGSELTFTGNQVRIEVSAQQDPQALGDPASAYRFAHVQQDAAGHRVARVLSARPLQDGTAYLAVVVPAYDPSGARSWTGAAAVTVPVYDAWRFSTAVPPGSFEDLAAQLVPGEAPASTGHAPLHYPRLANAPELSVLGALVAGQADDHVTEDPLPSGVRADLAALRLPGQDPQGRPIITFPRYGQAWPIPEFEDGPLDDDLNLDPRHRGVAGLGLEVGIRAQEDLVDDVLANLGALREARQRVRHLALGLAASRSLWQRRVPADPAARLWLLGPSLNRLLTSDGTVGELATADDRTIPRGTFSAAARRVLRAGPARTALAAAAPTPAALATSANRPPSPPPASIDGVPLDNAGVHALDTARAQTIQAGHVNTKALLAAATGLAASTDPAIQPVATQIVTAIREAAQAGKPVPWGQALAMLAASDATVIAHVSKVAADQSQTATTLSAQHQETSGPPGQDVSPPGNGLHPDLPGPEVKGTPVTVGVLNRGLSGLLNNFPGQGDDADLTQMLAALGPVQPADPALRAVDLDALAAGAGAAFNPTGGTAPAAARVLATIEGGIDPAQPLAPPEPCIGLDRPAWADLAEAAGEWLLPGVGQLPDNCVTALESDPIFIDAYLAGLNTQLLGELRWRNIPIATGCTPIRRFWNRTDTGAGQRSDDITGVASWAKDSRLGDPAHLAPGATGRELVIVVRGALLLRYPTTLVYLQTAIPTGSTAANFGKDPDDAAPRILPGFHGRIGTDVVFFGFPAVESTAVGQYWLVFEEPPAGYRFHNNMTTNVATGHEWAAATLAQPVRVLISGDSLGIGGHA